MSELKSHLAIKLENVIDTNAVDAVVECICAYENVKSDKDGLLAYLEDIFNIGKKNELDKIITDYIEMIAKLPTNKSPKLSKQTEKKNKHIEKRAPERNVMNVRKSKVNPQCKCMSNRHKFYASCGSCGWIMCEKDNSSSTCTFCGADIIPSMTEQDAINANYDLNTIKAYKQKDKLLLFDKENAKRTHVHDAQADYYESSTWLSEEEKRVIDEKEKKRRENRNKLYANRKINITFDISGRKIVEYSVGGNQLEDEEHEIQIQNDLDAKYKNMTLEDTSAGLLSTSTRLEDAITTVDNVHEKKVLTPSLGKSALDAIEDDIINKAVTTAVRPTIVYDDNRELEYNAGRAGEVYRFMKKSWEEQDNAKLRQLEGGGGGNTTSSTAVNNVSGGNNRNNNDRRNKSKDKKNTDKTVA